MLDGAAGMKSQRVVSGVDSNASGLCRVLCWHRSRTVVSAQVCVPQLLIRVRCCVRCLFRTQVDSLQQLELQAAALLLRMEQLRRVITSTSCQYRAFCTWLLKTIQQLERTQDANGALGR